MIKNVFVSTGGTGGHIFPAVALSESLIEMNIDVYFITDERFKKYPSRIKSSNINCFFLNILSPANKIKFFYSLFINVIKITKFFIKIKPDVVIGFGGYPTLPVLISAVILRKKFILHEANTVLGKVNSLFLPFCSYLTSGMPLKNIVTRNKIILTGNPIDSKMVPIQYTQIDNIFKILILGGSQGASVMTNVVSNLLVQASKQTKYKLEIYHQSPVNEIEKNKKIYFDAGLEAKVESFFEDMFKKISDSHLIITRAGAGTISEILAIGRPAIYIPLPNSAKNHQLYNAEFVANNNAGFIIHEDKDLYKSLLDKTNYLLNNTEILEKTANNAKNLGMYDSTNKMLTVINGLNLK